jgi:ammonia channel protein AmtB
MILATSLVMLMTPGLAFFYGGLDSNKNILSIMMQSFVRWVSAQFSGLHSVIQFVSVETWHTATTSME